MVTTNRNSFLSELTRLLTFMCEEDRKAAMTMFEKIFDDAPDEQALIAHLVTPTRQAVALARVYDSKERQRAIESEKNGGPYFSVGRTPSFMETIDEIYKSALNLQVAKPVVLEDQISLFTDDVKPQIRERAEQNIAYEAAKTESKPASPENTIPIAQTVRGTIEGKKPETAACNTEKAQQKAVTSREEKPEKSADTASPEPAQPAPVKKPGEVASVSKPRRRPAWKDPVPEEETAASAGEMKTPAQSVPQNIPATEPKEAETETQPAETAPPAADARTPVIDVDSFVSAMKVDDVISAAEDARTEAAEKDREPEQKPEGAPEEEPALICKEEHPATENPAEDDEEDELPAGTDGEKKTVCKTSVPILILYILVAIPVTALIITLLLVVAATFLALAAAMLWVGVTLISSAFGGFSVFADIMVVLGTALVLIALGVLFLWTCIWLIGGAIVGAVRGAIRLGGKISSREVAENA